MTKENLYRAIGNIDDKYLKDIIYSEKDINKKADFVSYLSSDERMIEVVVGKRKTGFLKTMVAVIFIACITTVVSLFAGTRKETKEYAEKKIENYFREDKSFDLSSEIMDIDKVVDTNDGMYVTAYMYSDYNGCYVKVFDSDSNMFKNIDIGEGNKTIYKMYSGKKYLWIAFLDENEKSKILRINAENLQIVDCTELNSKERILQIKENKDGSAELELYLSDVQNNITSLAFCTFDNSMAETDRVQISSSLFSQEDLLRSYLRDEKTGEYYIFYETEDYNISMYKYSAGGDEIYHKDNITSDMDGVPAGYFINSSDNPVVLTHYWGTSPSGENTIWFNEFDSQSGEICGMYEADLDGYFPCIMGVSGRNYSDKYDFIYVYDGNIFGFDPENEKSEILPGCSGTGEELENPLLVSSGNGPLMIYGEGDNSAGSGWHLLKMDYNGNVNSKNILKNCDVMKMRQNSDGEIYALVAEHEETPDILTDKWYLCTIDDECNFTDKIYLDIDNNKIPDIRDFIVHDETIAVVAENTLAGRLESEILYFDRSGNAKGSTDCEYNRVVSLFESGESIYALCCGEEKSFIVRAEPGNMKSEEIKDLEFCLDYNGDNICTDGNKEYDLFIRFDDGIYGYKMTENMLTEYINWMDSDIYLPEIKEYTVSSRDRMFVSHFENSEGVVSKEFDYFTRVDDETLKKIQERKILNIAFVNEPDDNIYQFFKEYNSNSESYRIHIDDFSKYNKSDNILGMSSHLESEIVKGNIPDMIFAGSEFDWLRYSVQGMFENVENLSEKDMEFDKSKYFENFFDAYKYGGKTFTVPLIFDISCMSAKKSVTGGNTGYTYDELMLLGSEGNLFSCGRYTQLLERFVLSDISEYIDFETAKCDFDNQDFIKLLNIIKNNGIPDDDVIEFSMLETGVPDNLKMFNLSMLSSFVQVAREQQVYIGEEASYIGYPSASESSPLVLSALSVGICANSKNKDKAWNIIKYMLSDEFQTKISDSHFPVSRTVFDTKAEQALKNRISGYYTTSAGKEIKLKNIDEDTVNHLKEVINSIDRAVMYDSRTAEIIKEEFDIFIKGGQSAEDAAKSIQNKVSIYLKEIK